MEEKEKDLIRSKITDLIKYTDCNTELLVFFHSKKILTDFDVEDVAAKNEGSSRTFEFYRIIQTRTNAFKVLLEGLTRFNQDRALRIIKGEDVEPLSLAEVDTRTAKLLREKPSKSNIAFDIRPPVDLFTGRSEELEELHKMVLRSKDAKTVTIISQLTTVTGLGGIGKTQLARHYIAQKRSEFDGNVLWLNSESESSLADSFRRLSTEKLGLSTNNGNGKEKSLKGIAEDVYKYFEGCRALFVFDNSDKTPWLNEFLPSNAKFYSLVTSRNREWGRGVKILNLDVLLKEDAIFMVKKGLEIEDECVYVNDDVMNLVDTLQCFPLALQQAIAYISNQQVTEDYSIKEYLQEFQAMQLQLLSFRDDDSVDETYLYTTATTWQITMYKIASEPTHGKIAIQVMNVIAYLSPDYLRRSLFYRLPSGPDRDEVITEDNVKGAVRLLVRYSMLDGRDQQSVLSVHRLVQAVTRGRLFKEGKEEPTLETVLKLLESDKRIYCGVGIAPSTIIFQENTDSAIVAWSHTWRHQVLIQRNYDQVIQILINLMHLGRYNDGISFGNEVLSNFIKVYGSADHEQCLRVRRLIGRVFNFQHNFEQSFKIFEEITAKAKVLLGTDSIPYLAYKEDLAFSFKGMGKYEVAFKLQQEVLVKRRLINGETHPHTLYCEENLGVILMDMNKLDEAFEIFQKLIHMEEYLNRNDLEQNVPTGMSFYKLQNYIGHIYFKKGNFQHALKNFEEIYKNVRGFWIENAPFVGIICSNLGGTLCSMGKYEEALEILENAVCKIKKKLGYHHYSTLELMKFIGYAHAGLGNIRVALEIFQNVHKGFVDISGENSLDVKHIREIIYLTLAALCASQSPEQSNSSVEEAMGSK